MSAIEPLAEPTIRQVFRRYAVLARRHGSSGALSFLAAGVSINLSAFAFHAIVSRALGPDGYGQLGPLINLLQVLSLPLAALQAAVTRKLSSPQATAVCDIRQLTLRALALSTLVDMVIVAAAPAIDSYLHFRSPVALLILLPWVQASVIGSIWQGALIADRRYGAVALALFLGAGPVRLILGALLSHGNGGAAGPVLATTIGALATPLLLLKAVAPYMAGGDGAQVGLGSLLYVVFCLGGVVVLGNLDAWVARHFLTGEGAGMFTAAVTLGRIPLFLPQALCTLAFPVFVASRGTDESRKILRWALLATVACAVLAVCGLMLSSGLLTSMIFGNAYAGASRIVWIIGCANCFIAVTTTLTYHQLAIGSRLAVIPWLGCLAMVISVLVWHQGTTAIAWDAFGCAGAVLLADAVPTLLQRPFRSGRSRRPWVTRTTIAPIPSSR